ncbi:hypothetical protein Patl1_32181 [Pistacia atlantica]|uniref:Uncharacterized protein n=1 Tax=Pistacia atlantica TaxID=434234 RepID=A0ACC1AQC7_9ROSI|nr:hypothetical protein Patl1_32181 [Pistacia atlantica]
MTVGGIVEGESPGGVARRFGKKIRTCFLDFPLLAVASSQWVTIGGIVERETVGGVVKGETTGGVARKETTVGVIEGREETDKNGSYKKIQNRCHSS